MHLKKSKFPCSAYHLRGGLKFVKQLRAQAAPFASILTALDFLPGSRNGVGKENRGNRSLLLLTPCLPSDSLLTDTHWRVASRLYAKQSYRRRHGLAFNLEVEAPLHDPAQSPQRKVSYPRQIPAGAPEGSVDKLVQVQSEQTRANVIDAAA